MHFPVQPLFAFAALDSTQLQAQRLRDSQEWSGSGVLFHVCADFQHQGRGRFTRTWEAPLGMSSLVSSLVRVPVDALPDAHWLTAVAVLSARDAVVDTLPGLAPALAVSWPNDLLLSDRKVAGVLAATLPDCPQDGFVDIVVGAGINVTIPADHLPTLHATSLLVEAPNERPNVAAIRSAYAAFFEARCAAFVEGGFASEGIHQEFSALMTGVGHHVEALHRGTEGSEPVVGVFVGIDADGSALVRTASGVVSLNSADMSFSKEEE